MSFRKFAAGLALAGLFAQGTTRAHAGIPLETYLKLTDVAWISASPDGSRIAYTSEESGTWQLWVCDADGTHRRQLTNGADAVHGAWWLPSDPHTILITMSHGNSGVDQFYYARDDRAGIVPLFPKQTTVTHVYGAFSPDGSKLAFSSNMRTQQAFDVYVLDRRTGKTRRVYTSPQTAFAAAWSPDARHLLVQRVYTPYNEDLYAVDLQTGVARLLTPHAGDATFESSQFTHNMRGVLCVTDLNREFHTIARIDLSTRAIRAVLTPPYDVDQVVLSPDGRRMAYIFNREGYGDVAVADASGRTIGAPSMPPYIAENLFFTRGNRVLMFAASGPTFPKVIWSYDLQTRKTTQILHPDYHGIPASTLVEPAIVHVHSFDGTIVPAWYFRPKNHHGKLTVLVDIHGGPEEQDRAWFYPFAQYLASRGYALLDPNIRGSSGYGRTYVHMADARKRENAVKDVRALREWLVKSGDADPRKIFIDGASYGGYIALASLYNYPYAFAGGIDIYGVADWVSFLEHTKENRANREGVYGSLARDRTFLASISPINHVSQIKRPVLIVAGNNDTIVPVSQSIGMAAAIRRNGVPVMLHVLPNEGHGFSKLADLVATYRWMIEFMQRYANASL